MNQLAKIIRKLNEGDKELDSCKLTSLERAALHSINNLTAMSPEDLAAYLQHEGDPTDWLIIPISCPSTEALP